AARPMNANAFLRERLAPLVLPLLAALCMAATSVAFAQSQPADEPPATGSAAAQVQRQATQPHNNEPVWKEVRSGAPQVTQVRGRETNVLMQPAGETWRTLRNSMVSVYAGWALVILLLVIAAFYVWK